jgi:hypothetical protein
LRTYRQCVRAAARGFGALLVTGVLPGRCVIVTIAAEPHGSDAPSQRHAEYTGFTPHQAH